jgi:hypothetical protein
MTISPPELLTLKIQRPPNVAQQEFSHIADKKGTLSKYVPKCLAVPIKC